MSKLDDLKAELAKAREEFKNVQGLKNGDRATFAGPDGSKGINAYWGELGRLSSKVNDLDTQVQAIEEAIGQAPKGSAAAPGAMAPASQKLVAVTIQRVGKQNVTVSVPVGTCLADILNEENITLANHSVQAGSGRPGEAMTQVRPDEVKISEPMVVNIAQKVIGG